MRLQFQLLLLVTILLIACKNNTSKETESIGADSLKPEIVKKSNISELNKALANDPNNADLYFQRSVIYLETKLADDAMSDIERALKLDSLKADFLLHKAELLFRKGKGLAAIGLIQKSIDNNPQHIDSYLKMAEMKLYTKQTEESIKNINEALRIDKYSAKAYFLKGMNYKYIGDTAKAVSSFQTAVEQNTDYYESYMELGVIYAAVNDPLAVSYYNNALKVKPNSIEAIYNKSLFLQENDKLDEAIQGYRLINSIDPAYQAAYYNVGFIHLVFLQQYDSAITYFNKALKLNPAYFDAAYNVGYSYELKGDKSIAKQFYTKTLQLKPDHTLAAKGLSRVIQ